ncbi:hypothetical protein [Clostridium fallax]|uniref:Uncharacterized protein n=1 Tax=Clostridium fallax TaxID=1533 RepID=A0A1M4XHI6_9CLOT|nr:hypothetical protein [Clostridium fallax]SHE92868.1 hypothetical protein SAMN05443638_11837 [Clostridium fallax]SQB06393.1 Uncharacterised protein [Clostridium fallax]
MKKKINCNRLHEVMKDELKEKGMDVNKVDKDLLEKVLKTIYNQK